MTTEPTRAGPSGFPLLSSRQVRAELLAGREIALLDVREEHVHAQAHPLFAAHFSFARLELDAYTRLPRRDVQIVVLDDGEGLDLRFALRLRALGYTNVALLDGGLEGWRQSGGELFRDVNVPSKAFGELVEAERHTPSLSAEAVKALIDRKADVVVLDARRYEEYRTMSIPGGVSVPGAELALRVRELAPHADTQVIVNCAGRTRSIIGAQSLINAGLPNPVAALRNGTIGWTLAGQALEHGQTRRHPSAQEANRVAAAAAARALADRAGVLRIGREDLAKLQHDASRSTYYFDVRNPEEYADGSLAGFRSAPGGQLVQETEQFAPVRGARFVLADSDGVRANMTASWLRQMNHEVHVLDGVGGADFNLASAWRAELPPVPVVETVDAHTLRDWLRQGSEHTVVLDFTSGAHYQKGHIGGAWFALRSRLRQVLSALPPGARRYVLTCGSGLQASFVHADLVELTDLPAFVLEGGTAAWVAAGYPLETNPSLLASPLVDRYRRPYEGTAVQPAAMQAYLDWEYGLVAQLERDGTHGFRVLPA